MNSNEFLKMLISQNPEAQKRTETEQYKLAEQFTSYRLETKMSSKKFASFVGIDHELYIQLESGDSDIEIKDYLYNLNIIRTHQNFVEYCANVNTEIIFSTLKSPIEKTGLTNLKELIFKNFNTPYEDVKGDLIIQTQKNDNVDYSFMEEQYVYQ